GSVGAGSSVAQAAGKEIKKTVLELGGSDPFIVMPSANLQKAVETAVQARIINNGQSCIAAKRFIVDRRIAGEFEKKFVERMKSLNVGDPMESSTDVGPLATEDGLKTLEEQVNQTVKMGARVLLGGKRLNRKGNFYEPTVLTDAIRIANETKFGLGACAWTNDEAEREMFINDIQSGLASIKPRVAPEPRIP